MTNFTQSEEYMNSNQPFSKGDTGSQFSSIILEIKSF